MCVYDLRAYAIGNYHRLEKFISRSKMRVHISDIGSGGGVLSYVINGWNEIGQWKKDRQISVI